MDDRIDARMLHDGNETRLMHKSCLLYTVNSFAYFMSWPLLTVLLIQQYGLSHITVGGIFTASLLLNTLVAFSNGVLIRYFGAKNCILAGIFLQACGMLVLGVAPNVPLALFGLTLVSLGRGTFEAPMKTYLSDNISDKDKLFKTFHLNYLFVNVGAALGPLVTVLLGTEQLWGAFLIAGLLFLMISIFTVFSFSSYTININEDKVINDYRFALKDRMFILLLISEILLAYVYIHYDTTLFQFINNLSTEQSVDIISRVVITNSVVVILTQLMFVTFLSKVSKQIRAVLGGACFIISSCLIGTTTGIFGEQYALAIYIAMAFVGIGEAILFPLASIIIDKISPVGKKGAYYSLTNLYLLGYTAGPIIGGWSISTGNTQLFWLSDGLFVFISVSILLFVIKRSVNLKA